MRKTIFYFTLVLFSSLYLVGCSSSSGKSISSFEGTGKYTFGLLEQVNVLDGEQLVKYFASTNDIDKYLTETYGGEKSKNQIYRRVADEQAEWPNYLYTSIYNLKRNAAMMGIEWNKIVYLDFVAKQPLGEGPYVGEVFFKYGDNVYSVQTELIKVGSDYYLSNLSGIQKVSR